MWQPFLFRRDSGGFPEAEAPTRYVASPSGTHLLVDYLGQCCRVSRVDVDGSPVSRRGEWDQILLWHLSQLSAESIFVEGSISEVDHQGSSLQAYGLTTSRMIWKKTRHLHHIQFIGWLEGRKVSRRTHSRTIQSNSFLKNCAVQLMTACYCSKRNRIWIT